MKTTKPAQATVQQKDPTPFMTLVVILLAFSLLCVYKPDVKNNYSIFYRNWGFDHISLYNIYAVIAFFAACFVIIFPYTNKLISSGLLWISNKLSGLGKKKILLFILISAASVFIFSLLTVKYYFLGDFNLRMNQTMKKDFLATEYLTMRALYAFATIGQGFGYTFDQLFKIYSYLAGGFFIFISLMIADLAGENPFQKILYFFAQCGSAVMLVFCGYVEIYATPILLLSLYFYFGLRYLKYKNGLIYAVLSLALAVASHLLCLAAVPSLVVAFYFINKTKLSFISSMSNKKIALILSGLILIVLVASIKIKSGFLLTLTAPTTQQQLLTLFDYRHFWELFNGLILSCGLSFIFIFTLLLKSIRDKKQLLSQHYFLLSISGCFLLLVFMANLQRGSGDWDIMAFPAVSLNLITIMLFVHLYKKQQSLGNYMMIAIISINSLNAFLWLQLNHTDRSIGKIKRMLINDPGTYYTARIPGIIQLAIVYTNNNLLGEAEQTSMLACNTSLVNDVKGCVMYGLSLKNRGKRDEACKFFEDLLQNRTPNVLEAYLYLLEYYEKKGNQAQFLFYLTKFYDSFIVNTDPFMNNVNFKPDILIQLFEFLYQTEQPANNTQRLMQIQKVITALKDLKPAK